LHSPSSVLFLAPFLVFLSSSPISLAFLPPTVLTRSAVIPCSLMRFCKVCLKSKDRRWCSWFRHCTASRK
jgi:hypothetical protein